GDQRLSPQRSAAYGRAFPPQRLQYATVRSHSGRSQRLCETVDRDAVFRAPAGSCQSGRICLRTQSRLQQVFRQEMRFCKMNLRPMALALALIMLPLATPSFAHHSTAMYNMANPVTVTGAVKRFEWTNPHAYIYLEVADEKGAKVEWAI